VSGAKTRSKGARGQSCAANLLRSRDWTVHQLTGGIRTEDIVATDPGGITQWSIEVKNCVDIASRHVAQARMQAERKKLRWMLMSHIPKTSSWLVQRQGQRPTVWHERADDDETKENSLPARA